MREIEAVRSSKVLNKQPNKTTGGRFIYILTHVHYYSLTLKMYIINRTYYVVVFTARSGPKGHQRSRLVGDYDTMWGNLYMYTTFIYTTMCLYGSEIGMSWAIYSVDLYP